MVPCKIATVVVIGGMPTIQLTDLAAMRLEAISFFAAVVLLASWSVQGLWNYLRIDFPQLPKLTYKRALAMVVLWGFVFVLVLTMISGARELMTPGAWKQDGLIYRLTGEGPLPMRSRNEDR
jgi:hypothetical protein